MKCSSRLALPTPPPVSSAGLILPRYLSGLLVSLAYIPCAFTLPCLFSLKLLVRSVFSRGCPAQRPAAGMGASHHMLADSTDVFCTQLHGCAS